MKRYSQRRWLAGAARYSRWSWRLSLWAGLLLLAGPLQAQTLKDSGAAQAVKAPEERPPLTELLRTPRETLKTLYYSVKAYDYRPPFIDDAIACLELDDSQRRDTAEAARLAIQLENILKELSVPLNAAPESPRGDTAVILNSDGCTISLHRKLDGLWRFDQATIGRIPAMYRAALAHHRDLQDQRKGLREGYTDPTTTLRTFLVSMISRDFYAAAQALDLSALSSDQREDRGPLLAQQLACVIQRRGWIYFQEVPNQPSAPAFTWHADRSGRIVLDRIRQRDGTEAWLFTKQTVANLPRMYEQALASREPDPRWVRLGLVVPVLGPDVTTSSVKQRPATVPRLLGSPRAVLKGFFQAMDEAEASEARLVQALDYLDLSHISQAERKVVGSKLATKLEAVLRKLEIDLATVSDEWNAPPFQRGQRQGLDVEILRQRDGCWRFSQATVSKIPGLFDKLAAQSQSDKERTNQQESARDTMAMFLTAINSHDYDQAATCLDLDKIHPAARDEVGPVLAFKLKYVIDRIGRVYIQSVPDEPHGARYVFYRGDQGRIVLARKVDGPNKGHWLFAAETVGRIEPLFRAMFYTPVAESLKGVDKICRPTLAEAPGIWLRSRVPSFLQKRVGKLDLYQWLGLVLAGIAGCVVSRLVLAQVYRLAGWRLKRSGSALTTNYVFQKMRPLTWVMAFWLFFRLLAFLDLPVVLIDAIIPLNKFLMAGLLGWLGFHVIDLVTAICTNSELLRPHRNLSEMVVPVLVRTLKGVVVILVLIDIVYQVGQGQTLTQFLTGLGVAGLAVSLAAQDGLKSFFGTLLLISERSFKLGDRIAVGDQEGIVEQVGFRSTRLRTPMGSVLTIPNATLASAGIDNRGAKSVRPYSTSIFIGYDTSFTQLATFRERLQKWLLQHPGIDKEKADIAIQRFTENGVELTLNLELVAADTAEEQKVRDVINGEVLRLAQSMEIGLANAKKPGGENDPAKSMASSVPPATKQAA
jgi:MscS family membrane protein